MKLSQIFKTSIEVYKENRQAESIFPPFFVIFFILILVYILCICLVRLVCSVKLLCLAIGIFYFLYFLWYRIFFKVYLLWIIESHGLRWFA